jgi:hypothetical protein
MQSVVYSQTGNSLISTPAQNQRFLMFALSNQFRASFSVTYAIEFLCLSVAKLMVLDRMSAFFMAQGSDRGMQRRWICSMRIIVAAVVLISVTGLCGNVAAAVYYAETGGYWSEACAALAINNTVAFEKSRNLARSGFQRASSVSSLQRLCEVVVLYLVLFSFAVVGVACVRIIRIALLDVNISDARSESARKIRLQIAAPVVVVFLSFLLRSVHATMSALANALQNRAQLTYCSLPLNSPGLWCEDACFNVYTHIEEWLDQTPEFELTIVLISSPLALLVALWSMTSDRALQLMRESSPESGSKTAMKVLLMTFSPGRGL